MEIEFSGRNDKKNYFKAVFWAVQPSMRYKIIRPLVFIAFVAIYITAVIPLLQDDSSSSSDISRALRHLITLLILAYGTFQPYIVGFLKAYNNWKDPSTRRLITGKVTYKGVRIGPADIWILWDDIINVKRTPKYIVLLTIKRNFFALPRSFFQTERDWESLIIMVDKYVKIPI